MNTPLTNDLSLNTHSELHVSVGPPALIASKKTSHGAVETSYAATEAQLEIWLSSQQSAQANCSYNEIGSLILTGPLDAAALEQSLVKVAKRNASLRTTFSADGQTARVKSTANHIFEFVDLSELDPTRAQDAQRAIVSEEAHTPFDLENGPLLRCKLQKLSDDRHKFTFTAHHIIMDGWSFALFGRDLGRFYDEVVYGTPSDLPLSQQYQHYAQKAQSYLSSPNGKADEAFWLDQFSDSIPILDLPLSAKRPALRTYAGARHDHVLSADLVQRVRKVGAKSGCSLFNVMLSAFSAFVARVSGCDDFCIGIPTAGQAAFDQPELIGHCVNALPWRTRVDASLSFAEYMKTSRSTLLNALEHQRYSYGTLLRTIAPRRDPARAPMLNISFNVDPIVDVTEMGFTSLKLDVQIEPRSFENFEWFINGVIQEDKSVEIQVQYNSDLFSAEAMQFYFQSFEAFLTGVADSVDTRIAALPLMTVPQRQKVIVDFNATEMDWPTDATLAGEFSRQAIETPDKVAVVFEEESLTYQQVESRSNQIARYLKLQDIGPGDLVGICVNRSAAMLVDLYAIMKTGAGYVPLDPAYPADRLEYMCDHSGLTLVVTETELVQQVSDFGKPLIALDDSDVLKQIEEQKADALPCPAGPTDICYVIYTSGSTGKPKGVQVPHSAVVNFLYSMKERPGFKTDDSVLAVTTLSFDIAVLELYLPTIFGGTVVIVDSLTATNGTALAQQLTQHDIALLQATPATWRLLIGTGWQGKPDLKVLCGGEAMPADLVGPLLERCEQLWNMYGPTETTVWSAVYQITDAEGPILIGKPIGNTQVYVLDAQGREVPIGCEGEVFIGGAGVTLGYRNQEDLTDERFVANRYRNPFANYVSDKIYKTGDLAKYRFDGNIEFMRRNDKQVKVRGFRIELGEIESTLTSHPAIEHNVVIVREDTPGNARLVAYVVFKPSHEVPANVLKDHLRATLPHYMIPQNFVTLTGMPQTNNGKIDYKALPPPDAGFKFDASTGDADRDADPHVGLPQTSAEKFLASVWGKLLGIDEIVLDDNFFDIGGHSLLVMQAIAAVKEKTGFQFGPQDFLVSTLEQLADKFSDRFNGVESAPNLNRVMTEMPSQGGGLEHSIACDIQDLLDSGPKRFPAGVGLVPDDVAGADSQTLGTVEDDVTAQDRRDVKTPRAQGLLKSLKGFWGK